MTKRKMRMTALLRFSSLAAVLLPLASGCSRGVSIKTATVTGKVTLDGQPLSGAMVTFLKATANAQGMLESPSTGVTGADGSYKLMTMASGRDVAEGAPPGDYKVIVTKQAGADTTMAIAADDPNFAEKMQNMSPEERQKMAGAPPDESPAAAPKSEVPARYGSPDTSGLTATVKESGAQTFDFPLTSAE